MNRRVRLIEFPFALTGGAAAGTVTSPYPISGELVEVCVPTAGTALVTSGGTTDIKLIRAVDGGTLVNLPNTAAPFQIFPRGVVTTQAGGTTAYSVGGGSVVDTGGGMPVDGYVTAVIADAVPNGAGTVYAYFRE
jgi:hypothetical protein